MRRRREPARGHARPLHRPDADPARRAGPAAAGVRVRRRARCSRPAPSSTWRSRSTAARSGCDPPRRLLRQAVEAGCRFSIDTDAHAPGQLDWQPYGCERAEECGVHRRPGRQHDAGRRPARLDRPAQPDAADPCRPRYSGLTSGNRIVSRTFGRSASSAAGPRPCPARRSAASRTPARAGSPRRAPSPRGRRRRPAATARSAGARCSTGSISSE